MRVAVAALVLSIAALTAGLLVPQPERAAADYNITGQWAMTLDNLPQIPGYPNCFAEITQTYGDAMNDVISITLACPVLGERVVTGSINKTTGGFSAYQGGNPQQFQISGTVSNGGHAMSGSWYAFPSFTGGVTGTGGNGDPKLSALTPTATATATPTSQPVGGVAFDASSGGAAFDSWWLAATTGAAFVVLGGAAVYTRQRFVS